jgi:hypothetical protein
MLIDQYKNRETSKPQIDFDQRVVYDCNENNSPYYPGGLGGEFIKKEDLIPIPKAPVQIL